MNSSIYLKKKFLNCSNCADMSKRKIDANAAGCSAGLPLKIYLKQRD